MGAQNSVGQGWRVAQEEEGEDEVGNCKVKGLHVRLHKFTVGSMINYEGWHSCIWERPHGVWGLGRKGVRF